MLTERKKRLIFDYFDSIHQDPILARAISFRTFERIEDGSYSYREFINNAIKDPGLNSHLSKRLRTECESLQS